MTVLPVNDAPRVDLAPVITLTPGTEVNLPVVVVDPDADVESGPVALSVDGMPPGLALVDGAITGFVAEDAQGTYYSVFTAEDPSGGETEATVEWAIVPLESLGEEPAPSEEAVTVEEVFGAARDLLGITPRSPTPDERGGLS